MQGKCHSFSLDLNAGYYPQFICKGCDLILFCIKIKHLCSEKIAMQIRLLCKSLAII